MAHSRLLRVQARDLRPGDRIVRGLDVPAEVIEPGVWPLTQRDMYAQVPVRMDSRTTMLALDVTARFDIDRPNLVIPGLEAA